jgi:hypothetical protein
MALLRFGVVLLYLHITPTQSLRWLMHFGVDVDEIGEPHKLVPGASQFGEVGVRSVLRVPGARAIELFTEEV